MKNKKIELDVDFIGGQGPLTKDEELVISKYIREYMARHKSKQVVVKQTKKLQMHSS